MQDPSQLLASLASGVRPVDLPERPASRPIEAWDFDQLLDAARQGRLDSGQRLRLVGAEDIEFDDAQAKRLAQMADAAEAGGLSRVAALIDGYAVDLDVADRSIGRVLRIAPESANSIMRAPFEGLVIVPESHRPPLTGPVGVGRGLAPGVLGVIGTID
jgi:hypothetical protein